MRRSSSDGKEIWGATIALLIFTLIAWSGIKGTLHDLRLQKDGIRTAGVIVEAAEDFDEAWHHHAVYEFTARDGRKITGVAKGNGRLRADLREFNAPVPVTVEYLPSHPEINQLRAGQKKPDGISVGLRHFLVLGILAAWLALGSYAVMHLYRKFRRQSGLAA